MQSACILLLLIIFLCLILDWNGICWTYSPLIKLSRYISVATLHVTPPKSSPLHICPWVLNNCFHYFTQFFCQYRVSIRIEMITIYFTRNNNVSCVQIIASLLFCNFFECFGKKIEKFRPSNQSLVNFPWCWLYWLCWTDNENLWHDLKVQIFIPNCIDCLFEM
mgnify:CR=1 FL=1